MVIRAIIAITRITAIMTITEYMAIAAVRTFTAILVLKAIKIIMSKKAIYIYVATIMVNTIIMDNGHYSHKTNMTIIILTSIKTWALG